MNVVMRKCLLLPLPLLLLLLLYSVFRLLPVPGCSPATEDQVLVFEEDGRLGNLVMEAATLLVLADRFNKTARLLPQMAGKLSVLLQTMPVRDHLGHL